MAFKPIITTRWFARVKLLSVSENLPDFRYWRVENAKKPENWPLISKGLPPNLFLEQFAFWVIEWRLTVAVPSPVAPGASYGPFSG